MDWRRIYSKSKYLICVICVHLWLIQILNLKSEIIVPLSSYESLFFWIFGISAIFAGLLTVMARNAVHSALFLISSLVSVAALFVLSGAEFIAGVQILVYVGGVMVLFLFVIMLVNVGAEEKGSEEIFNRPRQVAASLIFCALLVAGVLYAVNKGYAGLQKSNPPNEQLA